jgi:hypothetical protein
MVMIFLLSFSLYFENIFAYIIIVGGRKRRVRKFGGWRGFESDVLLDRRINV